VVAAAPVVAAALVVVAAPVVAAAPVVGEEVEVAASPQAAKRTAPVAVKPRLANFRLVSFLRTIVGLLSSLSGKKF
jgi:hypothetical protein